MLDRFAICLAALLLAAPVAAQNSSTDYDPVVDFMEKSPKCTEGGTGDWQGRAAGSSDEDVTGNMMPVSFVGCFKTQAECQTWLERAQGLIDGEEVQGSCEQRK